MIQTRVIAVARDEPEPDVLDEAAAVLLGGGLVAFATETVYGLGAVATDPTAVQRIFEAKGRPSFNPLIVHVAGIDQARRYTTDWNDRADSLANRFWPGPLTIILPRTSTIPDVVTGAGTTVGLRVPGPVVARRLIERVGLPLAAPSANRSNRISPTRAEHVLADLDGRVHLILDSGPASVGLESTVVDLTVDPPAILRPGPITAATLAEALSTSPIRGGEGRRKDAQTGPHPSPGMLAVHYAPRTPAVRIAARDELADVDWPARAALVAFEAVGPEDVPSRVVRLVQPEPEAAARGFYEALHHLDALGLDLIVAVEPPPGSEWDALRDRLGRATVLYGKNSRR